MAATALNPTWSIIDGQGPGIILVECTACGWRIGANSQESIEQGEAEHRVTCPGEES